MTHFLWRYPVWDVLPVYTSSAFDCCCSHHRVSLREATWVTEGDAGWRKELLPVPRCFARLGATRTFLETEDVWLENLLMADITVLPEIYCSSWQTLGRMLSMCDCSIRAAMLYKWTFPFRRRWNPLVVRCIFLFAVPALCLLCSLGAANSIVNRKKFKGCCLTTSSLLFSFQETSLFSCGEHVWWACLQPRFKVSTPCHFSQERATMILSVYGT